MTNAPLHAPATPAPPSVNQVEMADVVRHFGPAYLSQYAVLPSQARALRDIVACCTKVLGGQLYRCEDCHRTFWRYHCCRNRACPKCHGKETRQWLEQRQAELLPCDYFHVVATVPSQLNPVFRSHQKLMYGLLMKVSAAAVKQLCAQKRHLGALPGILSVLHTWTGELRFHPHVHMLITGGGVTPDGREFEPARGTFLLPVRLLSRQIARMFRDALQRENPQLFATISKSVWRRAWVSFCKHYGHGHDAVLTYLSRYVYRTAISNARILSMNATHVTFRYKDRNRDQWQIVHLPGVEFLRRFLQHVLPRGFHKVRYFGLWHPSKRTWADRAWLLLTLRKRHGATSPPKIADLLEALAQFAERRSRPYASHGDSLVVHPYCPHCGSAQTTFLAEWNPFGIP